MILKNRRELIELFEKQNYKIGIEVGVRDGLFSKYILNNTTVDKLILIDPWEANIELREPEIAYNECIKNIKTFNSRAEMVKGYSPQISKNFEDLSYDFIYIDALHDYKSVKDDIIAWYPKVRNGGILSGHDYDEKAWPGVFKAVNEFAEKHSYIVNITNIESPDREIEHDGFRKSWFIFKK